MLYVIMFSKRFELIWRKCDFLKGEVIIIMLYDSNGHGKKKNRNKIKRNVSSNDGVLYLYWKILQVATVGLNYEIFYKNE